MARSGKWRTVWREGCGIAAHWRISKREVFGSQIAFRLAPSRIRNAWRKRRGYVHKYARDLAFIHPERTRHFGLPELVESREEALWILRSARELHHLDLVWGARQIDLETRDKAAAAFGIELRHPFYDRRLIEFCLALPPEQKIRKGYTRAILRCGLASALPREIRERAGKADLSVAFEHGMHSLGRTEIEARLFEKPGALKDYIDLTVLREYYRQFEHGTRGTGEFVWLAIVLSDWLETALAGTAD